MTNQQTLTALIGGLVDEVRDVTGETGGMTIAQATSALANYTPPAGGGFDVSSLIGLKFYNQSGIDVSTLDTSGFTTFQGMFNSCVSILSLDVSSFRTSNVTNMSSMFSVCSQMSSLTGTNGWDTSNVTNMSSMFQACEQLTYLDLGSWDLSKVTTIGSMFNVARRLESINFANITSLGSLTSSGYSSVFGTCPALSAIIWGINSTSVVGIPSNTFFNNRGQNAATLYFYVRDSLVNSYKSASNWSSYASYIKPISELPVALQTLYNIDPNDYQ